MQAITTKYIGPTNARGSRIRAFCESGSITIAWNHVLDREANYRAAAIALCERLGWTGDLIAGSTKTGYIFVFAEVQP
ncbi:MAG: hypothetical protein ACYCOU_00035 [Sulfobacillus sp.]